METENNFAPDAKDTGTVWILLSLVGTPWLIFATSAIHLYVKNRPDLLYRLEVLYPFFALVALITFGALLLFRWSQCRPGKQLLWCYYLLGPLFLVSSLLGRAHVGPAGYWIGAFSVFAVFSYLVSLLQRRSQLKPVVNTFAIASAAFIAISVQEFVNKYEPAPVSRDAAEKSNDTTPPTLPRKLRPNVYHFVLDEFQTEMFSSILTPEISDKLGGFVFFPETRALFGRTGMSLPSIFSGRKYDFDTPQVDYQRAAFNSDKSFLSWLKQTGYETHAYIHPVYDFKLGLFDKTVYHNDYSGFRPKSAAMMWFFARFWFYSTAPRFVLGQFSGNDEQLQLDNQNLLNPATPVISMFSLRRLAEDEMKRSATNRYLFAHLILPHFPYVLTEKCDYYWFGKSTTPITQSRCATELVLEFIRRLKELGRFTNSLIIVQSDHGARFSLVNNELGLLESDDIVKSVTWNNARSRPLLLIKPPGKSGNTPLITSDAEVSLLDIAPTIGKTMGLPMPDDLPGVSLVNPVVTHLKRVRYYYFYDKPGAIEWTDKMQRYRIEDGILTREELVRLTNNGRPK